MKWFYISKQNQKTEKILKEPKIWENLTKSTRSEGYDGYNARGTTENPSHNCSVSLPRELADESKFTYIPYILFKKTRVHTTPLWDKKIHISVTKISCICFWHTQNMTPCTHYNTSEN